MPNYVNSAIWLPTGPGERELAAVVYKDPNGNLAVPTTDFVWSAGGVLIPAPVDANNLPMVSAQLNGSLANLPTATIANGASLSGAVDLSTQCLIGLSMPSTWVTTAVITFAGSTDNVTFNPIYYQGSEFTISEAAASRQITIDPTALLPWRYIKIRSGTAASPVNRSQDNVITLLTKPLA